MVFTCSYYKQSFSALLRDKVSLFIVARLLNVLSKFSCVKMFFFFLVEEGGYAMLPEGEAKKEDLS